MLPMFDAVRNFTHFYVVSRIQYSRMLYLRYGIEKLKLEYFTLTVEFFP